MRMRKISKKFCEAMRNFAKFRIMRFFAKCEFSHAIFSQNANFECNFRMRIFKGDYRMQKFAKIGYVVTQN